MADETREELTAYLDGELDAAASRQVEERLKRDPAYRSELARLEKAWDLLEHLERSTVSDAFTKTTMEGAVVAVAEKSRPARLAAARPWAVAATGLVLATSLLGYACGTWVWPDPNRQLLRDLPVLENIDLYDQGDSIEFLRKLERAGLFDEEPDHAG
jgi:anti-sigma factor RsiW